MTGGGKFEKNISIRLHSSNDDGRRVCRENEDVSLRDVELTYNSLEDFDSYDTIFIGYPIWWGIAAWPVNSFVQLNDFTGKRFSSAAATEDIESWVKELGIS